MPSRQRSGSLLFIVYHAVHAVIERAACHQPEMLDRPGFEKELVNIVRAVLRAKNPNAALAPSGRSSKQVARNADNPTDEFSEWERSLHWAKKSGLVFFRLRSI